MEPRLKHDFTNNCLRIEILQKIILEGLEKGLLPDQEQLNDYKSFLDEQSGHVQTLLDDFR